MYAIIVGPTELNDLFVKFLESCWPIYQNNEISVDSTPRKWKIIVVDVQQDEELQFK